MIIKKITVKRFRAIKEEKTVEFSDGLNVIKGSDNEAGKSSLRIAITKALFQDPTSTRKDIQELTSWGTDEPWEVALDFDANGDSYRITKSFKDKTCELASTGAHEFVAMNKNTIAEKIAALTGCPSEVFFESTACIGQEELIRIIPESAKNTKDEQNAVGTITKRLEAKLSGAEGVNIPALLAKLYSKTHHKEAEGPYFHLQKITERIATLRSQKLDQERRVNDILEKRRELTKARADLEKVSQELPAKQELWSKNKKVLELQKEIARDKAQYNSFQRAKGLKIRIDQLENELKPLSAFTSAEENSKKLDAIKYRIDNTLRQSADLKDELEALQKQKPALWMLVMEIALIVAGLVGLIANPFLWAMAVAGALLLAYWLITRRTWQKQVGSATRKMSQLERELHDSREEEQKLLQQFGCTDYEEYLGRRAEYTAKMAARRDAVNQLEALAAGKDWQKFVEENTDLDIQTGAKLKELQQLEPFKLEPLSLQKLENEVATLLSRKAELERKTGALEGFFQYTEADKDQLTDIEEELAELEQQRGFWEKRKKVYDLTREILEQAHRQTLSKAADLLEAEISRSMSLITEGRYGQVRINGTDLSIQTFSPDKNDWVDVRDLSRATQDQFYICARLALVRLITEGKRPPILLDDPFVNFHAKRLRKIMTLLQEIARDTQILLFTCSDSYDYLGRVIPVDQMP